MNKLTYLLLLFLFLGNIRANSQNLLHHHLTGKGKITLVFVHGWCIDQTYWDNQVAFFKDRYQVLTVDLAGHGESVKQQHDWSMKSYADDVVKLIKAKKLKNIVLIGHSMSGDIILRVQEQLPKRIIGFVGVDNFQEVGHVYSETEQKDVDAFFDNMASDFKKVAATFCNSYLFCPQTDTLIKKRVIDDVLKKDPFMAVQTLKSLEQEGKHEREAFAKMKLKLYVISCKPMKEASLKQYVKSGYDFRYIKESGHYPMIEQAQQFNERLVEILREIKNQ